MFNKIKEMSFLGFNIGDIITSDPEPLGGILEIKFDFKINKDAINSSAILDVDFFTNNDESDIHREHSRSFCSFIYLNGTMSLSQIDFDKKIPIVYEFMKNDSLWHTIHVLIKSENLWCPSRLCIFEDCWHENSEIIDNSEIPLSSSDVKKHKQAEIYIDNLKINTFNYFTQGIKYFMVSFGNNNCMPTKPIPEYKEVYESYLNKNKPISIKNISIKLDGEDVELNIKPGIGY
jgi:hypothetical protein